MTTARPGRKAGPSLGSFSSVDGEREAALLVGALDEQASLPGVMRLRARAAELLAPCRGQRPIDVGCGTGDVVRMLAVAGVRPVQLPAI
jgi:hypothetical protein